MNIEEIKKEIEFINSDDIIEKVTGGYSLAETYKITKPNIHKSFFLKVLANRENAVSRLKEIYTSYKKCNIKTPELIDCGFFQHHNKYYAIYEWIDGITLKQMVITKNQGYFYEIGRKVAQEMKLLRNINPILIKEKMDLNERINNCFLLLDEIPEDIKYRYFSKNEVNEMKEKLIEYKEYFKNSSKSLIHTDIKQGNIMLANNEVYIIDIEDMEYDYEVFNMIRWPIAIFSDSQQGKYDVFFQKGFMEEIGKNNYDIDKQVLFMYIMSFINITYEKYIKNKSIEELKLFKIAFDQTKGFTKLNYKLFN